ncbi:MAG: hypothetical protein HW389_746 [Bacteroidetes bacterium]|nr:hypothetical protein [Bacteroidota bacterium]
MVDRPVGMDPVQGQPARWAVRIDGEESRNLEARRPSDVTDEQWDEIENTAASVLSQCPNPGGQTGRVTGLALGKVQSGKTLSYTTLIALAVDNGYRITVVLAGTKNPLLAQNYTRLCNDLEVANRPRLTPFQNPLPQDTDVIQSVLHGGGHALIVVLKNRLRIDNLRRVLSTPELRGFPTLVIDDEGDEASLNTQFRRGRRSAIYNSILQLRDALLLHAYIAYTATPQANLLISGIDGLAPDFGILIQPGEGYCGGSVFFGPDRDRYVRIVPIAEAGEEHVNGIPDGLRRAIAIFIVGAAIRHLREEMAWHSMLIHNSNLRADHERLQVAVRNLIGLWRETLALPENDPAAADLLQLFREAFDDLCTTVHNPPAWEDVRRRLADEIRIEVWMVNSLPLGRDPIGTPFRLKNNILIGGNMLGRGVTIRDLAVTYITRRAQNETNADTMEQRARWFGYKQRYLDLCRIFLTTQLRDDYTELLRHEDDFWDALSRNQRQGLAIRDWPRMFALDMNIGIRPTRQNVANFRQFRSNGWDIQRKIIIDPGLAQQNEQVVRRFFRDHPGQTRAFANTEHRVVENCPTGVVIQELLATLRSDGTDWENSYTIEYLARLLLGRQLPNLDVLWMANGNTRVRGLARGQNDEPIPNQINNPMQGRTDGRRPEEREYYPGDEHIHNGRPQLQVHMIQPGESAIVTIALALYIPDEPRYDLRYVVRDEMP